jgi:hypothetical protein
MQWLMLGVRHVPEQISALLDVSPDSVDSALRKATVATQDISSEETPTNVGVALPGLP